MITRFVKTTMADWRDRDCCRIEFGGRTVLCPYLPAVSGNAPEADTGEILEYIKGRGTTLDGIVLAGEPLSDRNLYGFLKTLRKTKRPIRLDTWGTCPDALDDLAGAMMFDEVRLYVPAHPDSPAFARATGGTGDPELLRRSMETVNRLDIGREFFVYAVPGIIDGPGIEAIARDTDAKTRLTISQFDPSAASDPAYRGTVPYNKSEASALSAAAKRYAKRTELSGF